MYRTIETALWNDPKVRQLTPNAKLLFVYLITNAHTHVSGIYYLPSHYMSYDTRLKPQEILMCLKLLSDCGLIQYDEEREIVWIIRMFLHQGRGTKNEQAAASHLGSLHQTPLIDAFLTRYPQVQQYMAVKPKTKRGHLPTNLRFAVLKRDEFTCQYCGSTAPDVTLEVDHKIPKAHGGTDTIDNLLTSCQQCNHGKSDRLDTLSQDTLSQDTLSQDTLSDTEKYGISQEQEQEQEQEQDKDQDHTLSFSGEKDAASSSTDFRKACNGTNQAFTPDDLMALYNSRLPFGLPRVTKLSQDRRRKAMTYLRQFPDPAFWEQVLAEIHRSAFLVGLKPTPGHEYFRANFDWLLTKGKDGTENCVKVFEGRYRDASKAPEKPCDHKGAMPVDIGWYKCGRCGDLITEEAFNKARGLVS